MNMKFNSYIHKYHDEMLNVDVKHYEDNYGYNYSNSNIRFALKTLKQFLNNMLTPIWVRDRDFNILGHGGYEYEKYKDNIKIEFEAD